MKLDKFYSLRKDFVIIGLTGQSGAGCSAISKKLKNSNFIIESGYKKPSVLNDSEEIKFNICYNYLSNGNNFEKFEIINYKNILLLHLIYESIQVDEPIVYIIKVLTQYGDGYPDYSNRFGKDTNSSFIIHFKTFLEENIDLIKSKFKNIEKHNNLIDWLKYEGDNTFIEYFISELKDFSNAFYEKLNKEDLTKRTRFTHDIAINLREIGKCYQVPKPRGTDNLNNIYTVAESLNRIIKLWRKKNNYKAKIVIDALKNSLELMYFKEKYSGFYMLAINKNEDERIDYIKSIINKEYGKGNESHILEIIKLDNNEYKGDNVNDGDFAAPDIENCIQKSDFHIFHSEKSDINNAEKLTNLDYQLIRFLALIGQPGIITPTALERTMQVAFNAKYNSGCISRQVGAVITDTNYSIKSIGWNDVAQNQMPCKLRSAEDLVSQKSKELYSEYELTGGNFEVNKDEFKSFSQLLESDIKKAKLENLNGLNCSFCFKSFQNAYENEKNQVHTRSLHAEENAMMQITKNGGVGLKGGYLFTTASPCELCSKKAFQLGVEKIFFIDPYPGIARKHTLLNGIDGKGNPTLEMFRGAVGRTFHKLYEPFMSHKDEIKILTNFKPTKIEKSLIERLKYEKLSDEKKKAIIDILVRE
jgi:deoxycytidylate deaminase